MQEFPCVLSEYDEINSILYKPINSTQRIKYTCFGTSTNYIILGSTSGSVYLFSRKPCSFQQLIPLSEGAISHVVISPDENKLALATTRGSVCLLTLKPISKLIATSIEYINDQVQCLCWNDNSSEVYIGDGAGKVTVMVLSVFSVNGMFRTPTCMLMSLDSAIVQLNFSSPLLLVSTLTRCYVCDTVQEQYKHIGNKARNGQFGACFYKANLEAQKSTVVYQKEEKLVDRKRSFNFIPDDPGEAGEENLPKIFCARPGSRLWEVSANGTVINTHQFKEALAITPVAICRQHVRGSVCKNQEEQKWTAQSINFSHLSVVAEKYLFSYTSSGLYVIDPASATVVLWCNEFTNVAMAETIGNRIYTMNSEGDFRCLILLSLDSLILRLYNRKQYHDCLYECLSHRAQLEKLIGDSELWNICDIENKLQQLEDEDLSTILHPIILALQSNLDACPKKLDSGIVMVHSGNLDFQDQDCFSYKLTAQTQPSSRTAETTGSCALDKIERAEKSKQTKRNEINDANCNIESSLKLELPVNELVLDIKAENNDEDETNLERNTTQRVQIDLETIYTLSGNIRPSMNEKELESIMLDINRRMNTIKDSYETLNELKSFAFEVMRSAEMYYFNALLENVSSQLIRTYTSDQVLKELTRAFVDVNMQCCTRCTCGYPCLITQLTEPKFLGIGRSLLRILLNENKELECVDLCNKVPYIWREYLPTYVMQKERVSNDLLRQCLQTRDSIVLSFLFPLLDSKQWSLAAACWLKLKEEQCLFCGQIMRKLSEPLIDWNGIMREITKNQGPDIAVTVLARLETAIPNVPIDKSIFQSLVFTKILHQHGMKCAIDFNKSTLESSECNTMCSRKVRDQLIDVLEKDLGQPIKKCVFGTGAHHWGMRYQNKSATCPCCTLSLHTPILLENNGIAIFYCGHAYHVNCMIEKKLSTCNLH